ncbi:hypothetical protein [Saccharopolyspora thermophila]|uniref:Uncharacterized protein n=1 Tax=Saccharopolyspora thermophila TaxID=89367 RepID=A0ABP3M5Q4_9PSEU
MSAKTNRFSGSLHPLLAGLHPYLTITVLECTETEPAAAFQALIRFLDDAAQEPGQALTCQQLTATTFFSDERIDGVGTPQELGFDSLHASTRQLVRPPSWATKQYELLDISHQLTVALRRNRLVAIYGDTPSKERLGRWLDEHPELLRPIPYRVLAGAFVGDQRSLWTRGVHTPRPGKQDSKAMTGLRLQDALDPLEDSDFSMTAAAIAYQPPDPKALVRDRITLSPQWSRISWRATSDLASFVTGVREILEVLDKVLADAPPAWQFGPLTEPEQDLSKVRFAVDVSAEEQPELDGVDEATLRCVEFLRTAQLEVEGTPDTATATLHVTDHGTTSSFLLTPEPAGNGIRFRVQHVAGTPMPAELHGLEDRLRSGNLLRVHYRSGHACNGRTLYRRNVSGMPFRNIKVGDFTGYHTTVEKPRGRRSREIHQLIGTSGDTSLFGWVANRYRTGWLVCDDGSGEIADRQADVRRVPPAVAGRSATRNPEGDHRTVRGHDRFRPPLTDLALWPASSPHPGVPARCGGIMVRCSAARSSASWVASGAPRAA